MSLYQPGDTVMIRSDLESDKMYESEYGEPGTFATPSMLRYAGRTVTIRNVHQGASNSWFYKIKEDKGEWWWCDGMFVPVETKELSVDESDWNGFFFDYSQQKGGV